MRWNGSSLQSQETIVGKSNQTEKFHQLDASTFLCLFFAAAFKKTDQKRYTRGKLLCVGKARTYPNNAVNIRYPKAITFSSYIYIYIYIRLFALLTFLRVCKIQINVKKSSFMFVQLGSNDNFRSSYGEVGPIYNWKLSFRTKSLTYIYSKLTFGQWLHWLSGRRWLKSSLHLRPNIPYYSINTNQAIGGTGVSLVKVAFLRNPKQVQNGSN